MDKSTTSSNTEEADKSVEGQCYQRNFSAKKLQKIVKPGNYSAKVATLILMLIIDVEHITKTDYTVLPHPFFVRL